MTIFFDNKIKFCGIDNRYEKVWPHPKPASNAIPEEYKKLEKLHKGDLKTATAKACMPFLDAMAAGYIIPFDQDYVFDPTETEFTLTPANKDRSDISYHDKIQAPKEWHHKIGEYAGKFINKWIIVTPPGYSCLFTQPMNRLGEDRFQLINGIVDTDTYIAPINFPFILLKRDKQFLIKKGESCVQVIPFKRETWKMSSGFYYEKRHAETSNLLDSEFIDRYKKMFWHKKSFK